MPHLVKGLKYTNDDLINILPSTGADNISKQNEMDEDFHENESQDE